MKKIEKIISSDRSEDSIKKRPLIEQAENEDLLSDAAFANYEYFKNSYNIRTLLFIWDDHFWERMWDVESLDVNKQTPDWDMASMHQVTAADQRMTRAFPSIFCEHLNKIPLISKIFWADLQHPEGWRASCNRQVSSGFTSASLSLQSPEAERKTRIMSLIRAVQASITYSNCNNIWPSNASHTLSFQLI